MSPAETSAVLRQFNKWLRGNKDGPQLESREINQAINAAIEMLDRLEAAESEAIEQARLNGMGSEREAALMAKLEAAERERDECNRRRLEAADHFAAQTALMKQKYDDLRVKVAEMERQEPVGKFVQHPSNGLWEQDGYGDNPDANPLYALPGAKALLRVPDAVMAALDNLDDYIARIEGNDRGACNHINLLRRYLLDATDVGENK